MSINDDNRPFKQIDDENLNSKKAFIQYPIPKICNLRCEYCFHQDYFQGRPDTVRYANNIGFTPDQFQLWMDTHIFPNFDEIVMHFSGGEPFFGSNWPTILGFFIWGEPRVKFDFLTNGLFEDSCISKHLKNNKHKIHRVGCTFHRKTIGNSQSLCRLFSQNVQALHDAGVNVYVKELLHKEDMLAILKHRNYWENQDVPFKIQDVQNLDGTYVDYNARDLALIDDEYEHQGHYCSCWQGYRSISIRGYDIAAGNVVACWLDPKIIGNVRDNTLDLNFRVEIDSSLGRRNVTGGDYPYSSEGTFDRDRRPCEH
jgi:hypothetical protein